MQSAQLTMSHSRVLAYSRFLFSVHCTVCNCFAFIADRLWSEYYIAVCQVCYLVGFVFYC